MFFIPTLFEIDSKIMSTVEALDSSEFESLFHTGIKWSEKSIGMA